jgi:hypothetical protein
VPLFGNEFAKRMGEPDKEPYRALTIARRIDLLTFLARERKNDELIIQSS